MQPEVHLVVSVCRQVGGDGILVKAEGAFWGQPPADAKIAELNALYFPGGQQQPVVLQTPHGPFQCLCQATGYKLPILDAPETA